jgi:hypothetical protein
MDRHAVFVDVGYVLASVAELLVGSPERHRVRCDFGRLLEALTSEISHRASLPLLRTYWYDASMTGQPEHDQTTIADLQGVRLRLGRLVRGEQKGVDSRLVRDLIVLARDRAVAEATSSPAMRTFAKAYRKPKTKVCASRSSACPG